MQEEFDSFDLLRSNVGLLHIKIKKKMKIDLKFIFEIQIISTQQD